MPAAALERIEAGTIMSPRLEILQEQAADPYAVILAISGFAAYPILAAEHGQDVLESPAAGKTFSRLRTVVLIAPQPDEPRPATQGPRRAGCSP
jgi:hypothetical protein